MKGKLKTMSIQRQSLLLAAGASAAIISLQFLFLFQVICLSRNDMREYAERLAAQTQSRVQETFLHSSSVATNLARGQSLQNYLTEKDGFRKYELYQQVFQNVFSLSQMNPSIGGVCVYDTDLELRYHTEFFTAGLPSAQSMGLADYLPSLGDGVHFLIPPGQEEYLICCVPVKGTGFNQYSRQKLGWCAVFIGTESFSHLLWSDNTYRVFLENQELGLIYPEEPPQEPGGPVTYSFNLPIEGSGGWLLGVSVSPASRLSGYMPTLYVSLSIIVVSTVFVLGYHHLIRTRLTRPILQLQKELSSLHSQGLHTQLSGQYYGEMGDIAQSVNKMIENMYSLANRIVREQQKTYEAELREEQTRLYALQAQINPHFLFNTLQCLAGIAAAHSEPEIMAVSLSISTILRYAINRDSRPGPAGMLSLGDEVEIAKEYLKIMEVRFTGRFTWAVEAQEGALETPCLRMLLQPLIENAVTHGLENSYRDGHILLKCSQEGAFTVVEVHDNGAGIPAEKLPALQQLLQAGTPPELGSRTGHIGLGNIQQRIRLTFGQAYGLELLYTGPSGTGIRMRLPAGLPEDNRAG